MVLRGAAAGEPVRGDEGAGPVGDQGALAGDVEGVAVAQFDDDDGVEAAVVAAIWWLDPLPQTISARNRSVFRQSTFATILEQI